MEIIIIRSRVIRLRDRLYGRIRISYWVRDGVGLKRGLLLMLGRAWLLRIVMLEGGVVAGGMGGREYVSIW